MGGRSGQHSRSGYKKVKRSHGSIPLVFLKGVKTAVSFHRCVPLMFLSRKAFVRTAQCVVLNGVLFLGSILLTNMLVFPALHLFRDAVGVHPIAHPGWVWFVDGFASFMFQFFWFAPMYIISFILSTVWYNDIAREAFKHAYDPLMAPAPSTQEPPSSNGKLRKPSTDMYYSEIIQPKRVPPKDIATLIREECYRLILVLVLLSMVSLSMLLPYIGTPLSFCLCCFVYSFYSFEYKWALEGVPLTSRMEMLETQWVFLLGFGAPFTLATFSFSFFVSGGLYALLFPVNILLATLTRPQPHDGYPQTVPLFRIPKKIALLVLALLEPMLGRNKRRRRGSRVLQSGPKLHNGSSRRGHNSTGGVRRRSSVDKPSRATSSAVYGDVDGGFGADVIANSTADDAIEGKPTLDPWTSRGDGGHRTQPRVRFQE